MAFFSRLIRVEFRFTFNKLLPICCLSFATLIPNVLIAQPMWFSDDTSNRILLEILKPKFNGKNATTFSTLAYYLSAQFSRTGKTWLILEIPFARGDIDIEPGTAALASTFGNPYLGGKFRIGRTLSVEAGIRIPLSQREDTNRSVPLATDPVDRLGAYFPDVIPLSGMVSVRLKQSKRYYVEAKGGPSFWFTGGSPAKTHFSALWMYHGVIHYTLHRWDIIAGISGFYLLTNRNLDGIIITTPHLSQLRVITAINLGPSQIGIQARVPLTRNVRRLQDYSIGFHIGLSFGRSKISNSRISHQQ